MENAFKHAWWGHVGAWQLALPPPTTTTANVIQVECTYCNIYTEHDCFQGYDRPACQPPL